jgi:endonuclease/exonuclease/phosphatase family metal-dependent hydrolase
VLLSGGILRDAWANARTHLTPGWGTFVNYRRPRADAPRIDWIVVTKDVRVLRAAIDGEPVDGRWPSDHLPVHAVVRVDEGGAAR